MVMRLDSADAERVKEQQRKHWDNVANGWAAWIEWTEHNFRPLTAWLAANVEWTAGARVLDIACGSGYPALAAAKAVAPGGTVVACDLSPVMIEAASRVAGAVGVSNIAFRVMDGEALAFDDASFDAVTNAYGLMFSPDPPQSLSEACRVLKPGARAAFVTWAPLEDSPYFSVITGVGVRRLGLKPPAPGAPGPFRFSSPGELIGLLEDAGFVDVSVDRLAKQFECASIDQYCQMLADLAWKSRVAAVPQNDWRALQDEVGRAAHPFIVNGRLLLGATSLCASGRKP